MNRYEEFGKYLLDYLKIANRHRNVDWKLVTRQFAKKQLYDRKPGLTWINWVVCTYFGIDPIIVKEQRSRKRLYVIPRHISQYLAIKLFGYSQDEISNFYGITNRSLISNNNENVEKLLSTDNYYKLDLEIITNKLLGYDENENQRTSTDGSFDNVPDSTETEGDNMPLHWDGEIENSN